MQTKLIREALPRAARSTRLSSRRPPRRFQSSSSSASSSHAPAAGGSSFGAGAAGGIASAVLLYGIYYLSPAGKTQRAINQAAKQANDKYNAAAKKLQENTPTTDQAIDSIKQFAYSYVGWIPGGREYVDTAFKDVETIRQNNGEEADKLVNDAYRQLQDVAKAGLSMETLPKLYAALSDLSKKLAGLGQDAFADLLDNHPELKEKLGGSVDELKRLGEQCGPEAAKQVKETTQQAMDIMKGGFSAENMDKARKLLTDKVQKLGELRDKVWEKAFEEAKPYLDKNPKVKEMVEKNVDALRKGDAKELFSKAKEAIQSGDLGGLEKYVKGAVDKAKSKGSELSENWVDVDKYVKMIPEGDKVLPKLQQLREIADKHKEEGEKLIKETFSEISNVLEKKTQEARKLVDKAAKEGK